MAKRTQRLMAECQYSRYYAEIAINPFTTQAAKPPQLAWRHWTTRHLNKGLWSSP